MEFMPMATIGDGLPFKIFQTLQDAVKVTLKNRQRLTIEKMDKGLKHGASTMVSNAAPAFRFVRKKR